MDAFNNTDAQSPSPTPTLELVIKNIRSYRRPQAPHFDSLLQVQLELRKQRKRLLGSNVPFSAFSGSHDDTAHPGSMELIDYLACRTYTLWKKHNDDRLRFCQQFYKLCLACPSWITLDDVALMATTLVHSEKSVFVYFMEDLLPQKHHDLLHSFINDFPGFFCDAQFEDAVLEALLILLGVLDDVYVMEETQNGD